MANFVTLNADDNHELAAYQVKANGSSKGGLVLIQEIFGVNQHIQDTCDRFARHGYDVLAPALFDRVERDVQLDYTPENTEKGRALKGQLAWDNVILDVKAAAMVLLEDNQKVSIIGYCFGGSVAWISANRIEGFSCAVSYYGGQIAEFLDDKPLCPTLMHFGETDPIIPMQDVEKIKSTYPDLALYTYPAGHGFDCSKRSDYHAQSSAFALDKTIQFLKENLV